MPLWHHLSICKVCLSLKYLPILPDVILKMTAPLFTKWLTFWWLLLTASFPDMYLFSLSLSFQTAYFIPMYYRCLRMLLLSSSNSPVSVDCSFCPTFCSASLFCMLTTWWKTASSSGLTEHLSLQHCSSSTDAHRWETQ